MIYCEIFDNDGMIEKDRVLNDLSTLESGQSSIRVLIQYFLSLIQSLASSAEYPHIRLNSSNSELHGVGLVVFGEGETSVQVLFDERILLVCLHVCHDSTINSFLSSNSFSVENLFLSTFSEESLCISILCFAVSCEGLVGNLRNIGTLDVDFHACCNGVDLVDAFNWHAVDFMGASYKEKARLKLLEEDDSLSTESSS